MNDKVRRPSHLKNQKSYAIYILYLNKVPINRCTKFKQKMHMLFSINLIYFNFVVSWNDAETAKFTNLSLWNCRKYLFSLVICASVLLMKESVVKYVVKMHIS